jgi:hypothetical protein
MAGFQEAQEVYTLSYLVGRNTMGTISPDYEKSGTNVVVPAVFAPVFAFLCMSIFRVIFAVDVYASPLLNTCRRPTHVVLVDLLETLLVKRERSLPGSAVGSLVVVVTVTTSVL